MPMPSLEDLKARLVEAERMEAEKLGEANACNGAAAVLRGIISEIETPEEATDDVVDIQELLADAEPDDPSMGEGES